MNPPVVIDGRVGRGRGWVFYFNHFNIGGRGVLVIKPVLPDWAVSRPTGLLQGLWG